MVCLWHLVRLEAEAVADAMRLEAALQRSELSEEDTEAVRQLTVFSHVGQISYFFFKNPWNLE